MSGTLEKRMDEELRTILSNYQRHLRRERIENRIQWAAIVLALLLWLLSV